MVRCTNDGSVDSFRQRKALNITVGDPYLYHESAVPRLTLVAPGTSLAFDFVFSCHGSCYEVNYAQVSFFYLVDSDSKLNRRFAELDGDDFTWFVDDALWESYYAHLETETVLFTLVPVTESDAQTRAAGRDGDQRQGQGQ